MSTADNDWMKFSPVALWRDWIMKSEAQWSDMVANVLKDPHAGGMVTRQVDELRMLQRMYGEMAQASLAAANLPSRSDFEALDERMGRIEDAIARLTAEVVKLRESQGAKPRPRRDRKP